MKKLFKSTTDVWLGGVCGGIAESLNIDPSIVRIVWVVATVASGFVLGVVAYLAAWMILPRK